MEPGAEDVEDESHPCIRLEKKDLCMFLARLMEESPECCVPSDQFNKTGIVICESDKVHKIVAMSFSRPGLHAVQQIIRCLPSSLRDCTVYLSRKPCTTCTTFLIQGSVSSVYYWPIAPEKMGDDSVIKEDIKQADHMFLRSHISSSVLLPVTSFETVKRIAKKIGCNGQMNSNFKLLDNQTEDFEKYCSLFNLDSCKDLCVKRMENAFHCYNFLLECSQLEKKEQGESFHRHALQLCYFLAARSDDPKRGVGCALYSQDGYFFGAGYNGYPIGILYANLPAVGRRKRKAGFAKWEVVLHAEANVLLYRSKSKIEESDVLYCTKPPCYDCQKLLKHVKIKTIHCVKESFKPNEDLLDNLMKNFVCHEWEQCKTQLTAAPTDSKDNGGTEERSDEGPPIPYLKKEDLCIFLALHMENFPSESQKTDCKTGIVICEANKPKRIIALGCSTEELHAVPKVLLRFPNALKGCEVYMSRMPCKYCAKLLVQAQVSQVYYWPNFEIKMTENKQKDVQEKHAIFTESYIVAAVYVPTIDNQRKKQITNSSKRASSDDDLSPISSIFDGKIEDVNMLKCLNLEHLKDDQWKTYEKNLTTAKNCFKTLASCKDEEIIILQEEKSTVKNNPKYTHALQLCDLLASRSDNNNGVGTVIYKEDNIVALGYSGYPKGAVNSLFCKKKDDDFDKHAVVCAEANAIIMSSEGDLCNAELITTREPCDDCLKLIQAKNIAKVIWPVRARNQSRGLTEDPSEGQSGATADGEPA